MSNHHIIRSCQILCTSVGRHKSLAVAPPHVPVKRKTKKSNRFGKSLDRYSTTRCLSGIKKKTAQNFVTDSLDLVLSSSNYIYNSDYLRLYMQIYILF